MKTTFETFLKGHLRLRPLEATCLGLKDWDHLLEDLSPAGLAAQRRFYRAWRGRFRLLRAPARAADRQDARRLEQLCAFCLHMLEERPEHGFTPELVFDAYENFCLQELWAQTRSDWQAYLSRLKAFPGFLGQLETNLRRSRLGLDRRYIEDTLAALPEIGAHLAEKTPPEARRRRSGLEKEFAKAGQASKEALERLARCLREDILPRSRENFALGRREYAWRLKHGLGVKDGPEELSRLGRRLLDGIHRRMLKVAARISPGTRSPEDLRRLMSRLAAKSPANDREMLAMYRRFTERARRFVQKEGLFRTAPNYELAILPTPPGLGEALTTAMYFTAPPLDPSKKGYFLVSPSNGRKERLLAHNPYHAVSTAVHEAFPGHDMQYYLWQTMRGRLPAWRFLHGDPRDWSTSMNVEGFAHYAEELMREKGFYSPREELFQLAGQAWRAARIVLDVGLHAGGMSVAEASAFLQKEAYLDRETADGEAFRYSKWPTQALTYALGKLAIEDLKKRMKKARGRGFSEADFHDFLLSFGPLPPHLISNKRL